MSNSSRAETHGSRWITIPDTVTVNTPYYPTDGIGGRSTTPGDSELLDADGNVFDSVIIDGIIITDGSTTNGTTHTITIRDHADSQNFMQLKYPELALGLTVVPTPIPLGIEIFGGRGFSVEVNQTDAAFELLYRVVRRGS